MSYKLNETDFFPLRTLHYTAPAAAALVPLGCSNASSVNPAHKYKIILPATNHARLIYSGKCCRSFRAPGAADRGEGFAAQPCLVFRCFMNYKFEFIVSYGAISGFVFSNIVLYKYMKAIHHKVNTLMYFGR